MINCGEPRSVQMKKPNYYCEQLAWACRKLAQTLQHETVRHCR